MEKFKIALMGASTFTNNRGVSALAVSLVNILRDLNPNVEISFIIGNRIPESQKIMTRNGVVVIPTIAYRLSPKAPLKDNLIIALFVAFLKKFIPFEALKEKIVVKIPMLREISCSDLIADIQGGDSFSDIYGMKRFIIGIMPMIISILMGKKIVLLPQTHGPFNNPIAKMLARFILSNAYIIYSRDKQSIEDITKLFASKVAKIPAVAFCPDVAFMLQAVEPSSVKIEPKLPDSKDDLVGININGLMYNGGYTRSNMFGLSIDYKTLIVKIIDNLITSGNRILLIPHTYGCSDNVNSDPHACTKIAEMVENKSVHVLLSELDQSEVKGIIGRCGFFIGSRMHSCIAALSQGIPTVGLAYSKKFVGVFESVGAAELVIDCRRKTSAEVEQEIRILFERRENIALGLKGKVELIQTKINEAFRLIVPNQKMLETVN